MRTAIPRILRAVAQTPWAILPEKLDAILEVLELRATGHAPSVDVVLNTEHMKQVEEEERRLHAGPQATIIGQVAVVPVYGVMAPRMNMMTAMSGGVSTMALRSNLRQLGNDPSLKAIVLDTDSPGGDVAGLQELASTIRDVRRDKRVVAVANTMMASGAYWMGSQANEIVATPSADVGSIGVYAVHTDYSKSLEAEGVKVTLVSAGKYKVEGHPSMPLDETAHSAIQSRVDEYYNLFIKAIADGRNVAQKDVRSGYGEGRTMGASAALAAGMVDRIATLDEVLMEMTRGPARARVAAAMQARLEAHERFPELSTHEETTP